MSLPFHLSYLAVTISKASFVAFRLSCWSTSTLVIRVVFDHRSVMLLWRRSASSPAMRSAGIGHVIDSGHGFFSPGRSVFSFRTLRVGVNRGRSLLGCAPVSLSSVLALLRLAQAFVVFLPLFHFMVFPTPCPGTGSGGRHHVPRQREPGVGDPGWGIAVPYWVKAHCGRSLL